MLKVVIASWPIYSFVVLIDFDEIEDPTFSACVFANVYIFLVYFFLLLDNSFLSLLILI